MSKHTIAPLAASRPLVLGLLALGLVTGCHSVSGVRDGKTGNDTGYTAPDPDDTGTAPQDTAPPEPTDDDGDGFDSDEDCDDSDPEVNPDADEVPGDGIDNDCNGYVDEVEVCEGVDAEYETIQSAIDDAHYGQVILVCPGLYVENVTIAADPVTVVATDGPDVTTLQSFSGGTALTVSDVDGAGFEGFTITGGAAQAGGGVVCQRATLELVDNHLTGNEATNGGGLAATGCDLTVSGNEFSGNTADSYGGGIYLSQCMGTMSENTLEENAANYGGGLFQNRGSVTVDTNTFSENYASSYGGGMYQYYNDAAITGNTFSENSVDEVEEESGDGGALYTYYSNGDLTGNTFEDNVCANDGGAVYVSISSALISENVFSGNYSYDDAAGLRIYYGTTRIENNEFYDNEAVDDGGGLKLSHSSNELIGNYFEGNLAGDAGGGLEFDNETSTASENTFVGNHAHRGGGLHAWRNEGTLTISDSYFEGNSADDCGGAISMDNLPHWTNITNHVFYDNTALDGPAICGDLVYRDIDDDGEVDDYYDENYLRISNIISYGNEASDDGGTAYFKASHVEMTNFVIYDNEAPEGSALSVKESQATFNNGIIAENGDDEAIWVEESQVTVKYTDFYQNTGGNTYGMDDPASENGNIEQNPLFEDPENGDFTLQANSPCVDAGDPSLTDPDGTRSDMGAYGGLHGDW